MRNFIAQFGFLSQTIGFVTSAIGFVTSEIGFLASAIGFVTSEIGFLTREIGFLAREIGFLTREIGFLTQAIEFLASAIGFRNDALRLFALAVSTKYLLLQLTTRHMLKSELRLKYKELKKHLSEEDIELKSLAIANHLLALPIWEKNYFHIFLPIVEHHEVNTEYILHILSGRDKEVIVSKSNFKTLEMIHFLLTDSTPIRKNEFNIPEPVDGITVPTYKIQVVFVPLLAFDKQGHRVGFGKGFYDKLLSECKPDIIKIGLSFFEPEENISNTGTHDIPLDYCVTPKKIYTF